MLRLKHQKTNPHSGESGYTLLEGLMAVVVVAVLVSAIGPVIAFSVGTRLQAKRVELATQAAKSYIDWVKAASDSNDIAARSPQQIGQVAPSMGDLAGDCTSKDGYCTDKKLYCVNFDTESTKSGCQTDSMVDMVIQPVITNINGTPQQGYQMAVAVYRANSFVPDVTLKVATKSDSLTTNALGNRGLPLVVMRTEVSPSDAAFQNLKDRLGK